jgi:putative alpha-1,2-mannosidase
VCAEAEAKLDQIFRELLGPSIFEFWAKFPDASGLVGQFSMGNEPSLHIPYIYNRLGAPWKTQRRVRMMLETWFPDTTLGMPGDEGGGRMSSFVVFSMMDFYPVTPGLPIYDLPSPVFDYITISLHNGKTFRILCKNNSPENKYVKQRRLDCRPLNRFCSVTPTCSKGQPSSSKCPTRRICRWGQRRQTSLLPRWKLIPKNLNDERDNVTTSRK